MINCVLTIKVRLHRAISNGNVCNPIFLGSPYKTFNLPSSNYIWNFLVRRLYDALILIKDSIYNQISSFFIDSNRTFAEMHISGCLDQLEKRWIGAFDEGEVAEGR